MAGERAHAGDGRDLQFLQDDGRVTVYKRRGDAQAPRLHVDAQGQRRVDDAALLAEDAVVAKGDRVALLTDLALLVLLPGGAFLLLRARNGVDELEDVPGQLHGFVSGLHMDEGGAASGVVQRVVQRRTVQLKHDGFLAFLFHVPIHVLTDILMDAPLPGGMPYPPPGPAAHSIASPSAHHKAKRRGCFLKKLEAHGPRRVVRSGWAFRLCSNRPGRAITGRQGSLRSLTAFSVIASRLQPVLSRHHISVAYRLTGSSPSASHASCAAAFSSPAAKCAMASCQRRAPLRTVSGSSM